MRDANATILKACKGVVLIGRRNVYQHGNKYEQCSNHGWKMFGYVGWYAVTDGESNVQISGILLAIQIVICRMTKYTSAHALGTDLGLQT